MQDRPGEIRDLPNDCAYTRAWSFGSSRSDAGDVSLQVASEVSDVGSVP
jgi:hypothetical protein